MITKRERKLCPECGSVSINRNSREPRLFLCTQCHNKFSTPIIKERKHYVHVLKKESSVYLQLIGRECNDPKHP